MSYCVHCGVELDKTASTCPLCATPVIDPAQAVDTTSPTPFPTTKRAVEPASKQEVALLLSVMLASVAFCCALLNLIFHNEVYWSFYVIGAAVTLWVWLVVPLIFRKLHLWLRILLDAAAVGGYIFLISLALDGREWYLGLALPILLLAAAILIFLSVTLAGGRRSILSGMTMCIGGAGIFIVGLEFFIDRWNNGCWQPGWSLVVAAVCIAMVIPLVVVRRVPSLREEARRRFHL